MVVRLSEYERAGLDGPLKNLDFCLYLFNREKLKKEKKVMTKKGRKIQKKMRKTKKKGGNPKKGRKSQRQK